MSIIWVLTFFLVKNIIQNYEIFLSTERDLVPTTIQTSILRITANFIIWKGSKNWKNVGRSTLNSREIERYFAEKRLFALKKLLTY